MWYFSQKITYYSIGMHTQNTIKNIIEISGIGVHSGIVTNMSIHPSSPNTGISFIRTDLENKVIQAKYDKVCQTQLCTCIGDEKGQISTIEHLLSALYAMGIDNAVIKMDNEEMPILAGNSEQFCIEITNSGIETSDTPRKYIKILESVEVTHEDKFARFSPSSEIEYNCEISFDHPSIGTQNHSYKTGDDYISDISKARTFGFEHEIAYLQSIGLAKGGSLDNAIGLSKDAILNPEGLHYPNEFARHKLLDLIGDLYLAGYRIIGKIDSYKSGHELNNKLLHKLFETPNAFEIVSI